MDGFCKYCGEHLTVDQRITAEMHTDCYMEWKWEMQERREELPEDFDCEDLEDD